MAEMKYVEGLIELQDALHQLAPRVARKHLRRAVMTAARVVRDEAKGRAPIYHGKVSKGHPPPGTLKRAITAARSNKSSGPGKEVVNVFVRQAKNGSVGQKNVKAYSKLDAYYWRWVEFGTSKMAANPFLRPAFEANKEHCVDLIKQTLIQGIEEEAADLRKT